MKSPGEQQCDGQNQRGWQVWDAYFIIHQHNLYHTISLLSIIIDYRYVLIYCQTKYNRCQNWTDRDMNKRAYSMHQLIVN